MGFVGVHGGSEPLGHGFEGLVLIVEGGLGIYVHNVRHRVDGGPHSVGGDASVVEVSHPFRGHQVTIFVGDLGVGGTSVVVGFESLGAGVYVIRYFELLLKCIFEFLDAGLLLIFLSEPLDVSFSEGGDKTPYHGPKHVSGKPIELVSTGLSGSGREGNGRCFSHNS